MEIHLSGIRAFTVEHGHSGRKGGLSEAAFWVGLRQEIYVATIVQRAVKIDIDHHHIDRSIEPASDFAWANRAIVHCADVLNFCFGPTGTPFSRWTDLKNNGQQWHDSKPSSFRPFFHREPDRTRGEAFPEIWHSHPCHSPSYLSLNIQVTTDLSPVIGVQHYKLAAILLASHNPAVPRIGSQRHIAEHAMKV